MNKSAVAFPSRLVSLLFGSLLLSLAAAENADIRHTPEGWAAESKVTAHDGHQMATFGRSLAMFENTLVVGAPYHTVQGKSYAGAVYVYVLNEELIWEFQTQLFSTNPVSGGQFGWAVDIREDLLVVGSTEKGSDEDEEEEFEDIGTGQAVIYQRQQNTEAGTGIMAPWRQLQMLRASNGRAGDSYGFSVALTEEYVVIGAPNNALGGTGPSRGCAYVYFRANQGTFLFENEQQLTAAHPTDGARFGYAMSADEDWIAIGAPWESEANTNAGAISLFMRETLTSFAFKKTRILMDAAADDHFGHAVQLRQNYLLAGARGKNSDKGAAYLYALDEYEPIATLQAGDAVAEDRLGWSVDIDPVHKVAVVGADHVGTNGQPTGATYVFAESDDGIWRQVTKLTASDGSRNALNGWSVAISDKYIAVGAPEDKNTLGSLAGAIYLYGAHKAGVDNHGASNSLTVPTAPVPPPVAPPVPAPVSPPVIPLPPRDNSGASSSGSGGGGYGWIYFLALVAVAAVGWYNRRRCLVRRRHRSPYTAAATSDTELMTTTRGGYSDRPMRLNVV